MSFINQGETDRENQAVGPDDEPTQDEMEEDLHDWLDQQIKNDNAEFERLLEREAEHQERERLKKECFSALLALGILPRSLAISCVRHES